MDDSRNGGGKNEREEEEINREECMWGGGGGGWYIQLCMENWWNIKISWCHCLSIINCVSQCVYRC